MGAWTVGRTIQANFADRYQIDDRAVEVMEQALRHFRYQQRAVFPGVFTDEELRAMRSRVLVMIGDRELIYNPTAALTSAVGVAPVEATGMDKAAATTGRSANGLVRRFQFGMMSYAFKRGQEDRFLGQAIRQMGEVDAEFLGHPEPRDWFINVTREAFVQDGKAAAHEGGFYRKPWGFDPRQVTQTTGFGTRTPTKQSRLLQDNGLPIVSPNSEYVVWPGHAHLLWMATDKAAEVFAKTAGQ